MLLASPDNLPVDELRRLQTEQPEIISCYLRLDPAARARRRYLVELRQRIREVESHLAARGESRETREAVAADLKKLVQWLSAPERLPPLPGLAVFLSGRLGLFSVVPLPRVHRNRLVVDRFPALHELLDAQETSAHFLAILVDRMKARFFDVSPVGVDELAGLSSDGRRGGKYRPDRRDAPGFGERDYHLRLRTEAQRHHGKIVEMIERLRKTRPFAGIAILGQAEPARALTAFLPREAARSLLGTARLNPKAATADQVARAAWTLQSQRERRDEAELVREVEAGVPTGWAANGARETLRALGRGQVRTLVIPEAQRGGGFRCRASGRLVLSKSECRAEGPADPVMNLVDAAIDDALGQGSDVIVIDDPELAGRIDGLAAVFRFRSQGG
jgi:peptide subunit release factor 1 (eRF1)